MKDVKSSELNDSPKETHGFRVNRREFLKMTGSGILVFFAFGDAPFLQTDAWGREPLPKDFNAFLKIAEDGRVSCFTGKIEMGQGIVTSLAQMLADELDVSLDAVDMVMGDTDLCPWDMGTFGSMSTRFFGPPLRAAGAEARQVLLELASEHLKIPIPQLSVENGVIFDTKNKSRQISYGRLARGRKIERHVKQAVDLKKPQQFKIMNRPITRRDALEKVTGKAKYAGDIRIPGMLYAKILRPPAHGARLVDVDLSGTKQVEGVEVIKKGDFVAVLHQYPDVAEMALDRIRATFDKPTSGVDDKTIFDHLLKVAPKGERVSGAGDLTAGEKESTSLFTQTYLDGYVAHAPIEPHTAIVHIEGNKATVWDSSQTPFRVKEDVARELGFSGRRCKAWRLRRLIAAGYGRIAWLPSVSSQVTQLLGTWAL